LILVSRFAHFHVHPRATRINITTTKGIHAMGMGQRQEVVVQAQHVAGKHGHMIWVICQFGKPFGKCFCGCCSHLMSCPPLIQVEGQWQTVGQAGKPQPLKGK